LAAFGCGVGALRADDEVYQAPEVFLAETFDGAVPEPAMVWLTEAMRRDIRGILGHEYEGMRVRGWVREGRTAWVLDEIGKMRPITVGVVVNEGRIERLKVLIYRESHGWEVKHAFFTDRFTGLERAESGGLSRPVDAVAGATLSVGAVERMAELALYLHGRLVPEAATEEGQ
jgi:hypothetical protein